MQPPKICQDPRFRAGRKLIQSGRHGAIEVFATLLEDAREKYGEASIETSPAYFEYGNALFRAWQREQDEQVEAEGDGMEDEVANDAADEEDNDKKPPAKDSDKKAPKNEESENIEKIEDKKEADSKDDVKESNQDDLAVDTKEKEVNGGEEEEEEEEEDDVELALSMMETAFAIVDNYIQSAAMTSSKSNSNNSNTTTYLEWAKREQLPRILLNLGDVLAALGRHADAVDAYTRELDIRERIVQELYEDNNDNTNKKQPQLQELIDRRKAVEANVMVAESLLACPAGDDVITIQTKSCLVKAEERVSFATGYYEKARDQLQDALVLMGNLAGKEAEAKNFDREKENICFASTLLMSVGEKLAAIEEEAKQNESVEPAKKKAKR